MPALSGSLTSDPCSSFSFRLQPCTQITNGQTMSSQQDATLTNCTGCLQKCNLLQDVVIESVADILGLLDQVLLQLLLLVSQVVDFVPVEVELFSKGLNGFLKSVDFAFQSGIVNARGGLSSEVVGADRSFYKDTSRG